MPIPIGFWLSCSLWYIRSVINHLLRFVVIPAVATVISDCNGKNLFYSRKKNNQNAIISRTQKNKNSLLRKTRKRLEVTYLYCL